MVGSLIRLINEVVTKDFVTLNNKQYSITFYSVIKSILFLVIAFSISGVFTFYIIEKIVPNDFVRALLFFSISSTLSLISISIFIMFFPRSEMDTFLENQYGSISLEEKKKVLKEWIYILDKSKFLFVILIFLLGGTFLSILDSEKKSLPRLIKFCH